MLKMDCYLPEQDERCLLPEPSRQMSLPLWPGISLRAIGPAVPGSVRQPTPGVSSAGCQPVIRREGSLSRVPALGPFLARVASFGYHGCLGGEPSSQSGDDRMLARLSTLKREHVSGVSRNTFHVGGQSFVWRCRPASILTHQTERTCQAPSKGNVAGFLLFPALLFPAFMC